MTTILVISDTHGNKKAVEKLEPLIAENDYVIHLGDGANDMLDIYKKYPEKVYVCNGNCDWYGSRIALNEWEIEIGSHKIFCCHGHKYGVKTSLNELKEEAIRRGCDVALYGHTHIAEVREEDGITLINPGSLSYISADPSYCYLVVADKKVVATIVRRNLAISKD